MQSPGHVPGAGRSRPVIGVGCPLGLFIRSVMLREAGHAAGCRQQAGGPQSPVASRSQLRNPTSNLLPHSPRQSDGRPALSRRGEATFRFVSEGTTEHTAKWPSFSDGNGLGPVLPPSLVELSVSVLNVFVSCVKLPGTAFSSPAVPDFL